MGELVFENQNAILCMFTLQDNTRIELVARKTVEKFTNRVAGNMGVYHLCFEESDLKNDMIRMQNEGSIIIREARAAKLFDGRRVVFLATKIGTVELLEEEICG